MKNNWLIIKSEGEIESGAITLLGASSKRGDESKIGFFGSGLKYTLALLLRKQIPFHIYQGSKEMKITQEITTFRKQEFGQIVVDGEKTSYTTGMGVDWKPWMAIRELYSNALDEPNCTLTHKIEPIDGEAGWTTICIFLNEEFNEFCEQPQLFFTDFRDANEAIYAGEEFTLFKSTQNLVIYRKGIRAHFEDKPWLFHYDLQNTEITETRVLKSEWMTKHYEIPRHLLKCTDPWIIKQILNQITFNGEMSCDWDRVGYADQWLDVIEGKWLIPSGSEAFLQSYMNEPHYVLPSSMIDGLSKTFGDKVKVPGGTGKHKFIPCAEMTTREEGMIESAILFLNDAETPIKFDVLVGDFDQKDILGKARLEDKKILISRRVFDRGMKELVCTLLEEQVHLESETGDFTRAMQNELIYRWVNALESKTNRFL